MAIQFTCSKCGTLLQVRDEHIGKRLRCPTGMIIGIIGVAILVLTVVIGALTFLAR